MKDVFNPGRVLNPYYDDVAIEHASKQPKVMRKFGGVSGLADHHPRQMFIG